MTNESIDPNQITITPGGAILYKGEDIRAKLQSKGRASAQILGMNHSCMNSGNCVAINMQCGNIGSSERSVNAGFCQSA